MHLLHAIHAVFDADPAVVADIAQDLEDRVVVVESRAGDAVLQPLKIADRAVTAGKIFESVSLGQEAVAGVHADDAVGDRPQQLNGIVAGDDGVGRVILHAEVFALGMAFSSSRKTSIFWANSG